MQRIPFRITPQINFDQPEKAFTQNPDATALFAELETSIVYPGSSQKPPPSYGHGHYEVDRCLRIPTRDGSYLLADVYHPIKKGKYPVLMTLGAYGKAFTFGCVCNQADLVKFEEIEDNYFSGIPPAPPPSPIPK